MILKKLKPGEQMLLSDIIDVYNGVYKNYDDYYKTTLDYNLKCREHNKLKPGENVLIKTYKVEKNFLPERHFNYIRFLAFKKGRR